MDNQFTKKYPSGFILLVLLIVSLLLLYVSKQNDARPILDRESDKIPSKLSKVDPFIESSYQTAAEYTLTQKQTFSIEGITYTLRLPGNLWESTSTPDATDNVIRRWGKGYMSDFIYLRLLDPKEFALEEKEYSKYFVENPSAHGVIQGLLVEIPYSGGEGSIGGAHYIHYISYPKVSDQIFSLHLLADGDSHQGGGYEFTMRNKLLFIEIINSMIINKSAL